MQKHQWRQHGIVHVKKGLPESSSENSQTEIRPTVSYAPPIPQISSTRTNEQFSYSHIFADTYQITFARVFFEKMMLGDAFGLRRVIPQHSIEQ